MIYPVAGRALRLIPIMVEERNDGAILQQGKCRLLHDEFPKVQKMLAQNESFLQVHLQQLNRSSTDACQANDLGSYQAKMSSPDVFAWIEQPHHLPRTLDLNILD